MNRKRVPFKREPLTGDEVQRLEAACDAFSERFVVWVLLDTGLRLGEFTGLDRDAIDFQAHRLVVFGKGGKRRVLPMSPRVRAVLENHFAMFNVIGVSERTIQRTVRAVASRARISKPVTPHVLRHTFAVMALQRGLSLPALQKLLGHEHLETTAIYLNLSPEEALREYREKF